MKICIDPGHGMSNRTTGAFDPGAVHRGVREADVVFAYGCDLQEELLSRGVNTIITRAANSGCPLRMRAKIAEHAGCDILLSLHCNAADNPSANGVEAFYRLDRSRPLAVGLVTATAAAAGLGTRKVAAASLTVLDFKRTAVLLELGFLSNDGDRAALVDAAVRARVVAAIADELLRS